MWHVQLVNTNKFVYVWFRNLYTWSRRLYVWFRNITMAWHVQLQLRQSHCTAKINLSMFGFATSILGLADSVFAFAIQQWCGTCSFRYARVTELRGPQYDVGAQSHITFLRFFFGSFFCSF
jgi:amino acid permease